MSTDFAVEDHAVYPGEYRPRRFDRREISFEPGLPGSSADHPPVNVSEYEDHYKIEIAVPGHTKDDFIVTAHKDKINVLAVKKKVKKDERYDYRVHEFGYDCFECDAPLPNHADSDFVSAIYNDGILTFFLSKTDYPAPHSFHPIVVY
jgi:HSP20 family protein